MPIKFNKELKTFHLYNKEISYIFKISHLNKLINLYFGNRLKELPIHNQRGYENFKSLENGQFVNVDNEYENISNYEFASALRLDMSTPSIIIDSRDTKITDYEYISHKLIKKLPYNEEYPHARNIENSKTN